VTLYVGTSGWDYSEWAGHLYPEGLPKAKRLEAYSRVFNGCELNGTFYGRQTERAVARWRDSTPDDFRFCAKAHMRITYVKELIPDEDARAFMKEFIASLSGLGEKLAAVLLSFPKFKERDDAALREFVAALPVEGRYAYEFRHESWASPEVDELVADLGGAVCISDDTGEPPASFPRGTFAYVRLRSELYDESQIAKWRELLSREAESRDVFVFARHKGIPPDESRAGVGLARRLADLR
jgi:uncharacterized protein YecE (DUF72 family)